MRSCDPMVLGPRLARVVSPRAGRVRLARDRINVPALVTDDNWTWRMPVLMDAWRESPEWVERAAALAGWCRASNRTPPPA